MFAAACGSSLELEGISFGAGPDLGLIAVDKRASLLVLEDDPRLDPETLARPLAVWLDGAPFTSN